MCDCVKESIAMNLSFSFSKTNRGQGLVEYAILIAFVAVIVIAVIRLIGPKVGNTFSTINASLGQSSGEDFVHVANEGETFSIPAGTYEVQYGANGVYYTQHVVGPLTMTCNAATFGDPLPGVPKNCSMRPAP